MLAVDSVSERYTLLFSALYDSTQSVKFNKRASVMVGGVQSRHRIEYRLQPPPRQVNRKADQLSIAAIESIQNRVDHHAVYLERGWYH